MKVGVEKYIEKTNDNLELSEDGIPLILNKEGEKVESIQFKKLIKTIENREETEQIYNKIKELEDGELKDSKLRDENGELVIVWHGSPRKFEKFNPEAKGSWGWRNKGTHFQSSKETIEQYALKAKDAWNKIAYRIGLEHFGLKSGSIFTDEQEREVKKIFNQIIEDLIKNGEDSKFFHKAYEDDWNAEEKVMEKQKRMSNHDSIVYGKEGFGTEWALEMFGGEMPTEENCSFNKKYGTYFGNDIGEYKYATLLNIEKPFYKEVVTATDLDIGFKEGEKSNLEEGTDGVIMTHPENIKEKNGMEINGTKNTYSASVFGDNQIKIIGCEAEGKFETRKDF